MGYLCAYFLWGNFQGSAEEVGGPARTTEDVLMEYRKRLSIRETARELDISEGAIRKCLITHGEIETAMTRRIGALLKEGYYQQEICWMLGISSSCVSANSPYERGMQIEPNQTVFQSTHPSHSTSKRISPQAAAPASTRERGVKGVAVP